ncbi:hypothetical protein [Cupriavidus sp. RAF12]|uniref:hypothetical protein n=1 Tax=Cupriavidus sp. RAF12 TaxID=3233050 RepID=UPI003F8FE93D
MRITERLKAGAQVAAGWLPDALMAAGAGSVSYGAGIVYQPAGYVSAGLFLLAAGWLAARGGK